MKKILFAASEGNPFIKTGGLADVIGALPKYFNRDKFDIRIILPKYQCIPKSYEKSMIYTTHFFADMPRGKEYIGIYKAVVEGITYYLVENEYYFTGEKPYCNIHEDVNKFAFYSRAVLECLPALNFCPDVIHCHDWQTGLIPVFLEAKYRQKKFFQNIKTVLTIHNQKFQGRFLIEEILNCSDLPNYYRYGAMEAYGDSNFLKAGILYADRVTTVSETYAKEIQTSQQGEGLDGVMREVSGKLTGITNGIDYEIYDSMTDKLIAQPFGIKNIGQKKKNKAALQKELGLKKDNDIMMIGMVSRLTQQKGFELVSKVIEELLHTQPVQIVILGTGEERFQHEFGYYAWKYSDKMSVCIQYSEEAAHKIYASADVFLMPSQFEPCGLSQLISMRYGTIPIVRETGGLKDTVEAYNQIWSTGNGFSFANYDAGEMRKMIGYALDIYQNHKKEWQAMMKRCMKKDNSWKVSVQKYETMYLELLA
ncbi:MAG: glycogen synthase GlgA [Lachnospiraceae bacterium]